MELEYNDVKFDLMSLDKVDRQIVYSPDGTSPVWIQWDIAASCVLAPSIVSGSTDTGLGGTSISTEGGGEQLDSPLSTTGGTQGNDVGFNPKPRRVYQHPAVNGTPILTDSEILKRLVIPRRPLKITARDGNNNEVVWLESPKEGFDRDCNNGPLVKAYPITAAFGQATAFAAQLSITTFTPVTDTDRLVLSHRWQMTTDRNENNYLARTVKGEIVFHAGMLAKQKLNPSWLKWQFFHPIPLGFRRTLGPITLSSNGTTLRYEYQDEDQAVVFSPGNSGATLAEVIVNVGLAVPLLRSDG